MVLHMYVNDQRKFDRIPFNLRYHYPVSKMTHFASANTLIHFNTMDKEQAK